MQKSYSCLNLKVRFCNSTSINVAIATSQMQAKLPAWVKVNKITYWLAYWLNLLTSGKAMEFEHSEDDLSPHYQDGIGCDSLVWQWTAKISSNCAKHCCCRRHDLLSRVPARYEQKLIAKTLGMSDRSVRCIAKMDLELSAFRRMPAQVLRF